MKTLLLVLLLTVVHNGYHPNSSLSSMENNTLTVEVYNLRNAEGVVRLSLYASADGFPTDISKAVRKATGKIQDGKCTIQLNNLPQGDYAISLLHDENNNGKMDTRLMGIPKEGYGASNDAKVTFGPPKYEDARFVLNKNEMGIRIKMRYM